MELSFSVNMPDWDALTWWIVGGGVYLFACYTVLGPIIARQNVRFWKSPELDREFWGYSYHTPQHKLDDDADVSGILMWVLSPISFPAVMVIRIVSISINPVIRYITK